MTKMYLKLFKCLVLMLLWGSTLSKIREHYVAVVEREWDYAPKGNLLHSKNRHAKLYLERNHTIPTIGTKYIKAMYREFTDNTFSKEVPRHPSLGILGPFLQAEVGDYLIIHFFNNATKHKYSMHPHGVFYNKDSEGAMYVDGTSGGNKTDDGVPPGGHHKYVWFIHPEYGPTESDPNCITWLCHSHHSAEEDVMTGAILIMVTCKPGTLDKNGKRKDVNKAYPLLFMIFDENFSLYKDKNIKNYLGINNTNDLINGDFNTFQSSNKKYSINGYIYGNLEGIEACEGDKISFHIAVIGNDEDVHSAFIQGHSMIVYHHRRATVGVYPGSSITALVRANNPGQWIIASQNVFYTEDGMEALLAVNDKCKGFFRLKSLLLFGKTRTYYIAAEEIWWNFSPSGYDLISGKPLSEIKLTKTSFGKSSPKDCKLNGQYKKAVFRGYTSSTFEKRIPHKEDWGLLGPPITAEVGDTVKVIFRNKASIPYSIQAYRFLVDYHENGIQYDLGPKVAVPPNGTKEYTWKIPEIEGPTEDDPDCLYGRYYSAVDEVKDTYSGLTGSIVICRRGTLNKEGANRKVDKEFYLMFSDFQEGYSHYFRESILKACPESDVDSLINNNTFIQANIMRSLNGYISGNLNGLKMCQNDKVNWYIMSVGSGMDENHSPHFHGNSFSVYGSTKDSYSLVSNTFSTLYMIAENPGIWSLEDQVILFEENVVQMEFLYEVDGNCKKTITENTLKKGKIRTYYIAAVEMYWDYASNNLHLITGEKMSENEVSKSFYLNDPENNMIGHIFKKALYREFTDDSFTKEKERMYRDSHLGMQGPFIKGEVGDTIRVVFKNMAEKYNFSIVPHGLLYDKANEGYNYNDTIQSSQKKGGSVSPGEKVTYEWFITKLSGPGPDDFNCTASAYTSHVDYARDISTGLIGPLIICREGMLDDQGSRTDVDIEISLLFFIVSEGGSAYIDDNIHEFLNKEPDEDVKSNIIFLSAKLAINGYIFGNVPNVTMKVGQRVAWYIISLGDSTGMHDVHWHGNTFVRRMASTHRHDVLEVPPGDFETVEMLAVNKGNWLIHCHVNNHSEDGMVMVYNVLDP